MSTSQAEPENDGTDYDEDALRSRLPYRLTDIQKDALVTIARNPTAPKAAIARAVDTDGSTVRNAAQAFVRGNYGKHGQDGKRQMAERRDTIREAKSFDELTDKQRAAVDFAARNWEWVNDDDTTYDQILGAIEEEHGETMHRSTFYTWVHKKYKILVDLRRDEVESEDDVPDVETMDWANLLDALEAELPFDFADENLDDLPEYDHDENAMSRRTRDSTGESTEDTRDETDAAGDRDVGIEMDAEGEQQLESAASVELPDGVRDTGRDPMERAQLIVGDMDHRIDYVNGLDQPNEVAERFADYLVAARGVIRALQAELHSTKAEVADLRDAAEEADDRLDELEAKFAEAARTQSRETKLRSASANLAKKVQEKDGTIRSYKEDNERLRDRIESLEDTVRDARSRTVGAEKRTQQLEIENDELRGELTELRNEFDLLEAENERLRNDLGDAEMDGVVMNDRTLRSLARALNRFNDEGRDMIDYRVEANAQSAIVEAKFGDTDMEDNA